MQPVWVLISRKAPAAKDGMITIDQLQREVTEAQLRQLLLQDGLEPNEFMVLDERTFGIYRNSVDSTAKIDKNRLSFGKRWSAEHIYVKITEDEDPGKLRVGDPVEFLTDVHDHGANMYVVKTYTKKKTRYIVAGKDDGTEITAPDYCFTLKDE